MNGFYYFFPGAAAVGDLTDELLSVCGLKGIINPVGMMTNFCSAGPDGKRGVVLADNRMADRAVGYYPSDQTWHECAAGAFWLGWSERPGPDDLLRPTILGGMPIKLGDDRTWLCPIAKVHSGCISTTLPESFGVDASGNFVITPMREHEKLLQGAASVLPMIIGEAPISQQAIWDAAVEALKTNYFVTQWEITALGLLNTLTTRLVCFALCDAGSHAAMIESIAAAQKKSG